jgi:hypothetical protein
MNIVTYAMINKQFAHEFEYTGPASSHALRAVVDTIDKLETDATNAYDLGDFAAYDRIIDELTQLEEERES